MFDAGTAGAAVSSSLRDVAQLTLLVLVFAAAASFVVSFARGLGGFRGAPEPPPAPTQWSAPANIDGRVVGRVEVFNSAGRSGLAREATGLLRDAGFDVVFYGNGSRADSSVVLQRNTDPGVARSAADALGIRSVIVREDASLLVDATVILGADWQQRARRD